MKRMTAFILAVCVMLTCAATAGAETVSSGLSFLSTMPIYREGTWIKKKYVAPAGSNLIANGGFETGDGTWNVPTFLSAAAVTSEPAAVHSGSRGLIVSPQTGTEINLISNSGFECGLDGWNASANFSGAVSSEAAFGGGHSLKIENLPRYATVSYTVGVNKNTDYTLNFRYLGNARYSTCVVRNASGSMIASLSWQSGNEGCSEWTLCSLPFSSGENTGVTVEIFGSAKGSGTYYLDDFLLTDGTENESCAASFPVTVEPDTEYLLGMWLKSAPFDPACNDAGFGWGVAESAYGEPVYSGMAPAADGAWHLVGYFFDSGDCTTVYVTVSGFRMTVYADDLFLCKSNDKTEYNAPEELIENPRVTSDSIQQPLYNASDNLFDDYDFSASDPGEDFWSDENGSLWGKQVTVSDSGSQEQGRALHYRAEKTPAGDEFTTGAYYMRELAVEPDTEYCFSVRYRIISPSENPGGEPTNFAILAANRKLPLEIKKYGLDSAAYHGGAWQTAAFSFTTGGYDKLCFSLMDGGGEAYFDDFILIRKHCTTGENLVDNGGFERNGEDWYMEPTGRVFSTDNPHSGQKSFYIQPDFAYQLVTKRVSVEKNTDYVFSFWYRGTPGWSQYFVRDTSGANSAIAKEVFVGNGYEVAEWTKLTVLFNSGDYDEYQVGVMTGGPSYPFWLDDISVERVCENEAPDTGLLQGGDFETADADGWNYSAERFLRERADAYSGRNCMKAMPGTGAEIVQSAAVEPYTNYVLSFYCRGAADDALLVLTDGSGKNLIPVTGCTDAATADWTYCGIRFNTGAGQTVRVAFRQSSSSAIWYVDDVKLLRADNRITGSESESGAVRVFSQRVQPGTGIPVCFSVMPGFKPIGLRAVPDPERLKNVEVPTALYGTDLTADAADGTVAAPGFDAVLQGVFTELADVNDDLTVNIADLIRLKRVIADGQTPNDGYSDLNGDNMTDSADLMQIRNRLLRSAS